jgi:hypothetical protein
MVDTTKTRASGNPLPSTDSEVGAPEIMITPAMYLAGVEAFKSWNEEEEEIECLVTSMFYSMLQARQPRS